MKGHSIAHTLMMYCFWFTCAYVSPPGHYMWLYLHMHGLYSHSGKHGVPNMHPIKAHACQVSMPDILANVSPTKNKHLNYLLK